MSEYRDFTVRRVVTGFDAGGKEAIMADAAAPSVGTERGPAFSTVLWIGGPVGDLADGGDAPAGPFSLEPPAGGCCSRVIRIPPPPPGTPDDERWLRVPGEDPAVPGMHATDTLDLMVVLDGEIVLGLGDGEHHLSAGDFVVQRGTVHRWRVVGDIPCTYAVTMFRADHARPLPVSPLAPRPGQPTPTVGLRRLVTGTGEGGTSAAVGDGTPPVVTEPLGADGPLLADVWQTGGQVVRADQGGDVDGGWALDPVGNGVAFRVVELPLDIAEGGRGWHATHTIDVDFIMAGPVELELPGQSPVRLEPGDVVVQRGTEHLWRPVGERRPRLVSVMIGVD